MSSKPFKRSERPTVLRVVADTNVLVSGTIIRHGPSARLLEAVLQGRVELVLSPVLLAEYEEVIQRPHIVGKYPVVEQQKEKLLRFLRTETLLAPGNPRERIVPDDPDDDFVIACALDGNADYIISGDPHLTELRSYQGIEILPPAEFVTRELS